MLEFGDRKDFDNPRLEWRRLFSELLGTFFLVLAAAGGGILHAEGKISLSAAVVAPGLTVMGIILFMGAISGAHLNPAVSLAFALRGDFPWKRVPGYIVLQLVGATLACLFLYAVFGNVEHLGATLPGPGYADWQALLMEIVLTFGLVNVILGTASAAQNVGAIAALGVGGYIALAGLWAAPVSGASMNPVRSFGPALVSGDWTSYWVYVVGPIVGALIAVGCAYILRGRGGGIIGRAAGSGVLGPGVLEKTKKLASEIDRGEVEPTALADADADADKKPGLSGHGGAPVTDVTAVNVLIEPDEETRARARELNARLLRTMPEGFALDATHVPHITVLQRYVRTPELEQALDAVDAVVAGADLASLDLHAAEDRPRGVGHAGTRHRQPDARARPSTAGTAGQADRRGRALRCRPGNRCGVRDGPGGARRERDDARLRGALRPRPLRFALRGPPLDRVGSATRSGSPRGRAVRAVRRARRGRRRLPAREQRDGPAQAADVAGGRPAP